jgi:hypothetical protein
MRTACRWLSAPANAFSKQFAASSELPPSRSGRRPTLSNLHVAASMPRALAHQPPLSPPQHPPRFPPGQRNPSSPAQSATPGRRNKPGPRIFRGERGGVQPFAELGVQGRGSPRGHPESPGHPSQRPSGPSRHPMPTWKDPCPRAPAPARCSCSRPVLLLGGGSCSYQAPRRLWVPAWVRAAIWRKSVRFQYQEADAISAPRGRAQSWKSLSAPSG